MVEPRAASQRIRKLRWVSALATRSVQARDGSGESGARAVDTNSKCYGNWPCLIAVAAMTILAVGRRIKGESMRSVAIHRLEQLLETRKLDATLPKPWQDQPAIASSGLTVLDQALGGGWRRGEVSEITGVRSAGRTSVLVASLAAATQREEVVALVDTFDRFDPPSAAAAGLDLTRVLWIRGHALTGFSERPVFRPGESAGLKTRRSEYLLTALQKAVRACDLIIRAGGFGLVALDLADVPTRALRSLPWTTWRRIAHATEGRETAVLLLSEIAIGRSPRGTSIRVSGQAEWSGDSPQSRRLHQLNLEAQVVAGPSVWGAHNFAPVQFRLSA